MTANNDSTEETRTCRPIPDEATWNTILDAYQKVKKDTDDDDVALFAALSSNNRDGFQISYEVRQIPGKGRGIICTEFVPRGTCVCEERSGKFRTENEWRDFLGLLPHDLAKDVVDWALVDDDDDDREVVYLDFCEVAMVNHADSHGSMRMLLSRFFPYFFGLNKSKKLRANVKSRYIGEVWHFFTIRDIQAGEELLCDYSQSGKYDHSLAWFDEIYNEYYPGTPQSNELERWRSKKP